MDVLPLSLLDHHALSVVDVAAIVHLHLVGPGLDDFLGDRGCPHILVVDAHPDASRLRGDRHPAKARRKRQLHLGSARCGEGAVGRVVAFHLHFHIVTPLGNSLGTRRFPAQQLVVQPNRGASGNAGELDDNRRLKIVLEAPLV